MEDENAARFAGESSASRYKSTVDVKLEVAVHRASIAWL